MNRGFKQYVSSHGRTLLMSALIFLLLAVVAVGPLVYKVMADLSSAEAEAVQAKNAAISQAIINGDYNTWSSLVDDDKLKAEITAENFGAFAQAYALLEKGEVEVANIFKQQLNLKRTYDISMMKSAIISSAIAEGNYDKWRNAVGQDYAPEVTSGNFKGYADILQKINRGLLNRSSKIQINMGLKQNLNSYYSSSH
ncbi:MAG: hypothetical protein PHE20_00640 [Patescibacteria group bacterium]|nr:hypothetical protein [Patescibacteria group bacterium]